MQQQKQFAAVFLRRAPSSQLLAAFSDVTAAAAVALNPGFPHTTDSTPATLAQKCNCKMFFRFRDLFWANFLHLFLTMSTIFCTLLQRAYSDAHTHKSCCWIAPSTLAWNFWVKKWREKAGSARRAAFVRRQKVSDRVLTPCSSSAAPCVHVLCGTMCAAAD